MDEDKLDTLKKIIKEKGPVAIAFSGGVDSTFLLGIASGVLGKDLLAVTVSSDFMFTKEIEEAKTAAAGFGVDHVMIDIELSDIERFVDNPPGRCYHCKKHLFSKISEAAGERGFSIVCDASNIDDETDYRPGMRALEELGILSPLREAGLTKEDIRYFSKEMGYGTWDSPAMACLATRIPYNEEITLEKLKRIEKAEEYLRSAGFEMNRVRCHGDLARIEVAPEKVMLLLEPGLLRKVVERFKEFGFLYVTVDAEGYRMGSMNESLDM
ncbi:MAG: ATP-dependent sacrificial sulfur transferase LarE [Candidatus Krumholzibacteriota bacterium]|nr:ATP-dependent sacrificial sulfur transferase LarE [Candidatus Krumholzibacteriota bacterium]